MFNRRKRSRSSTRRQPLSGPPSQSAQSAASHAFLNSQPGSNLSSAAAAAALRSMTPTPTPVENVQTKRMAQRQGAAPSPPNMATNRRSVSVSTPLRRSTSSSSMTARTFRENSPHRPSTSSGPGDRRHTPVDVPPLPAVPPKFAAQPGSGRRSVSMDPSTRSSTVTPTSPRRLHVQTDQGTPSSPSSQRSTHSRVASLGALSEEDRPSSRNSINFSYPRGSRPTSPTPASVNLPSVNTKSVRDSPGKKPVARDAIVNRSGDVKSQAASAGSLDSIQPTTSAGAVKSTAVAAASLSMQPQDAQSDRPSKIEERIDQTRPVPTSQEQHPTRSLPPIDTSSENPPQHTSPRAALVRMPSTVQEENEPKEDKIDPFVTKVTSAPVEQPSSVNAPTGSVSTQQSSPPSSPRVPRVTTPQPNGHVTESQSPGRSARFSTLLPVAATDHQLHEPPPRSVSPAKSALKNGRGTSMSPDRNLSSGRIIQPPSEISDGTSIASDEGSRYGVKKRPGKVSFEDEAEVLGVAASPPTSPEEYVPDSPPAKNKSRMSWLGVGKKRASSAEYSHGDSDIYDVMKPRQALPSFGSVRGSRPGNVPTPAVHEVSDNESSSSSEDGIVAPRSSLAHHNGSTGVPVQSEASSGAQPHKVSALEQLSVGGSSSLYQPVPVSEGAADSQQTMKAPRDSTALNPPIISRPPPVIAIEPATPPVESDQVKFGVPMGSYGHTEAEDRPSASSGHSNVDESDNDSSDSVYSDAPEDLDGDGFGSINAIVDSPPMPRSPVSQTNGDMAGSQAVGRAAAADEQLQDKARPFTPTQDSGHYLANDPPTTPPISSRANQTQPSPQTDSPRAAVAKSSRPKSDSTGTVAQTNGSRVKSANNDATTQRPSPLGPAFQMKKTNESSAGQRSAMRRTMSNDSDSSSSFGRGKPGLRNDAPFSMRRTMRGSAMKLQESPGVMRTGSPDEYRPTSSNSGTGTMRKSLRGSGTGNERMSFFSTNNKPSRGKVSKAAPASRSMRNSRFFDSDDEADAAPSNLFRSRFADSSDEDEPNHNVMRPVRGIPRRQGMRDGDSTDLEDSSEDEPRPPVAVPSVHRPNPTVPSAREKGAPNMSGLAAVAKQRGMSQRELEEFMMQSSRGQKPGLLTRLGLKKPKHSENRIRKADTESPSRNDTPLERSRLERGQVRGDSYTNGVSGANGLNGANSRHGVVTTVSAEVPELSTSPRPTRRLSKRHTTDANQWPLPVDPKSDVSRPAMSHSRSFSSVPVQSTPAEGNGRAVVTGSEAVGPISPIQEEPEQTSVNKAESALGHQSGQAGVSSLREQGPSARDVVITGSGRKKRFPLIRKAFGLRG
ncbi:hypothetical protein PDE_09777 [Penicillium oxalicum 114-2]|uniref:Uncharacterized protein n=1 Tax=Penicillium oxalicum (strain 114-2 / CGMCC 5302) TaxID=933388 RepID=S8B7A4_PENO1|nr:hypothetical protein PDE_09777 [Penicillium oxalicum 114-2]